MGDYIFISYSRADIARARQQRTELASAGVKTWMDDDLKPGSVWEDEIRKHIGGSAGAMVLLSKQSSINSKFQQEEINTLLDEMKGREEIFLIPVRLEECELPRGLDRLHAVDAFKEDAWKRYVVSIAQAKGNVVSRSAFIPVSGTTLNFPVFFPSLSTAAKTTISVPKHIDLLLSWQHFAL